MNLSQLEIDKLPCIPLSNKRAFPDCQSIYFAIDSKWQIQYIGSTLNLRKRWMSHERYTALKAIGGIKIFYLLLEVDVEDLRGMERVLIALHKPLLNKLKPRKEDFVNRSKGKQNRSMMVSIKSSIDIPDLHKKIRYARIEAKKRGVNLTEICFLCRMTRANWYLIESDKTKAISIETLRLIEKALETDFGIKDSDFKK